MPLKTVSDYPTDISIDRLSLLLDSSRELFLILDENHIVQYASPSFYKFFVSPPDVLLCKPLGSLPPPQEQSVNESLLGSAPSSRTSSTRCRLCCKDGTWHWFDAVFHVRSGDAGNVTIASYLDVTSLHRMECERQVIFDVVHALNETSNLDQLLQRIHQALKKVLYAENCFVALHQIHEDNFHFPFYTDQLDEAPSPQKVGRSCTAYIFRTGKAALINQSEFDRLAALGEVELVGSP